MGILATTLVGDPSPPVNFRGKQNTSTSFPTIGFSPTRFSMIRMFLERRAMWAGDPFLSPLLTDGSGDMVSVPKIRIAKVARYSAASREM